jgi:UDP-N-acetylmuramoylalanine--D-glutamate ligase
MNKLNKGPSHNFLNLPAKNLSVTALTQHLPLPVAIIGMGVTGQATLDLLLACHIPRNEILTFDEKTSADFSDPSALISRKPKTLCISPGISLKKDWIVQALADGAKLTSELALAFSLLEDETVIAITGSVGKSTTTSILGEATKIVDSHCFVGGNLGITLAQYVCQNITDPNRAKYLVLELSSYQLENFDNLIADVGVITSLNPNHLERYLDAEEYYQTKISLFDKTKSVIVLNQNGGDVGQYIPQIKQRYPHLKCLQTSRHDLTNNSPDILQNFPPKMIGAHNLDNLAVGFAIADFFSWPRECKIAMLNFAGLAHRLENCGQINGVTFVNDSKATTIDSVLQAVRSVLPDNTQSRLHLLLGGKDKNLPWEELSVLTHDKNIIFYFFGEYGAKAQVKSKLSGSIFPNLNHCLAELKIILQQQKHQHNHLNGDLVLLSPGGTSLDEFKNFEERGNYFKNWVRSLKNIET